ncbi:MAG: hypothetical protein CL820_02690 [Croceicoccus sp.]|nr:hypothetical protein [Croceicoccus sp.]MAL24792.1 hypothetical protein [Croceicoccus sp.]
MSAVEITAARNTRQQARLDAQGQTRIGLDSCGNTKPRLCPRIIAQREIAQDGAERVRPCGAVDIAVWRNCNFKASSQRLSRCQSRSVETDSAFDVRRKLATGLHCPELSFCCPEAAKHRVHARKFETNARRIGLFIEDAAQFDSSVTRAGHPIGEHHRQTKARLGPQFYIRIGGQRPISNFGRGEIARIARVVSNTEQLGGRHLNGSDRSTS